MQKNLGYPGTSIALLTLNISSFDTD